MRFFSEDAALTAKEADGDATLLRLRAPGIAGASRPFQFVMVKVPGERRILRRPFSVFDRGDGYIEIMVRCVGRGTTDICAVPLGENLNVTGPFGEAFQPPADALYVAGGIGVAGIYFAVAEAARAGAAPDVLVGAKCEGALCAVARLKALGVRLTHVTDDGSSGATGLVSEYLPAAPAAVVACGPRPMFLALREKLTPATALFVVMEERMACGVGACRSCAVPTVEPPGGYAAACEQGPVFDASRVDWERLRGAV